MKPGVPWNVKGIQPDAREAAKIAARGAGLTLGQWLNEMILEQEAPGKNGAGASSGTKAGASAKSGSGKSRHSAAKTTAKSTRGKANATTANDAPARKSAVPAQSRTALTGENAPVKSAGLSAPGINLDLLAERIDNLAAGNRAIRHDEIADPQIVARTEEFGRFAQSVERNQQRTETAMQSIEEDLRRLAETVDNQALHGSDDLAPGMQALEKALFNVVDHIELTDRRNGEVLKTVQGRLADLSNRVGDSGGTAEAAALDLLENRLGMLADRFERLETEQQGNDYSLLENQLMTLNQRVDDAQRGIRENPSIDLLEQRLDKISARLDGTERTMPRGSDVAALNSTVATLREDFDRSNTATRPAVVQAIETRLNTLTGELDGLRRDESVKNHLDRLSGRLEEMTARQSRTETSIAQFVDPHPQIADLEARVETLAKDFTNGVMRSGDAALKGLESQISAISKRLDQNEERFSAPLQSIEASLSQLFESLERSRIEAIEAAEQTAVKAAQKLLAKGMANTGAPATDHTDTLTALENGLNKVRSEAGEADRRTHETLEAVHDTLERVIERLGALESHAETASAAPAPVAADAAGAADGSLDNFRLPPLPGMETATGPLAADAYGKADDMREPALDKIEATATSDADTDTDGTVEAPAETEADNTNFSRTYDVPGQTTTRNEDFIAAARRAAQAANEAIEASDEKTSGAAKSKDNGSGKSRRRTLLFAVAALFIAAGALSVSGVIGPNLLGGSKDKQVAPSSVGSIAPLDKPAMASLPDEPTTEQSQQVPTPRAMSITLDDPAADFADVAPVYRATTSPTTIVQRPQSGQASQVSTMMPTGSTPIAATDPARAAKSSAPGDVWTQNLTKPYGNTLPSAGEPKTTTFTAPAATRVPRAETSIAPPPKSIGGQALRRSAASGKAPAQFEIGARYAQGRNVSKDLAKAAQWYQRAAAQGLAPAQYRLGALYEKGQGVAQDKKVARLWYQRAAEQGNVKAMHNLGVILTDATLGRPDFARAARWFKQAAQQGLTDSQYNLGVLHQRGLGVQRDPVQAYKWFAIAATKGDGEAAKQLAELERTMSANVLAKARGTVKGWRASRPMQAANSVAVPAGGWGKPATRTARQQLSPASIARTQLLLKELGYTPGGADGIMGRKTSAAITEFQRERGLDITGQPSQELFRQLEAAAV